MRSFWFLMLLFFGVISCNKEKRYSTRLMRGDWEVKEVSIAGTNQQLYGEWYVTEDVNIYDSVPGVEWVANSCDAQFEWQFQNKGKKFQMNYRQLCSECDGTDLDTLDHIVHDLSGTYDVVKHGRNRMIIESTQTLGHSGEKVSIEIQRKK